VAALGPEIEIDAVQEALAPGLPHQLREAADEAREVLLWGEVPRPVPKLPRIVRGALVDVDQVHIGGVIEFLAPQLAEAEDGQLQPGLAFVRAPPARWPQLGGHACGGAGEGAGEQAFSQRGELSQDLAHPGLGDQVVAAVANGEPSELGVLEAPKRIRLLLPARRAEGRVQARLVVGEGTRRAEVVLHQVQQGVGVTLEELGEEGRDPADHPQHPAQLGGPGLASGFETRRIGVADGLDQRRGSARSTRRLRAFGECRFEIRRQVRIHGVENVGTRVGRVKLGEILLGIGAIRSGM